MPWESFSAWRAEPSVSQQVPKVLLPATSLPSLCTQAEPLPQAERQLQLQFGPQGRCWGVKVARWLLPARELAAMWSFCQDGPSYLCSWL